MQFYVNNPFKNTRNNSGALNHDSKFTPFLQVKDGGNIRLNILKSDVHLNQRT